MQGGTRVRLTDDTGTREGTVMTRHEDGVCVVDWDAGSTSWVHERDLIEVGEQPAFRRELQKLWDKMAGR